MSLLSVRGLSVSIGPALAIEDVSFELGEGGSFGLVGESGCGKTTTAKALLGLLPSVMRVCTGSILFRGTDLLALGRRELNQIRWRDISLVTQSAMNALDPVSRVGTQIVEAIRGHAAVPKAQAERRAEELFIEVGLDPAWTRRYPHEFSGGMRQRAIIAMALACGPALIIADEPTTALDVIVQDEVFDVLSRVRQAGQQALLLISHDLALVAENCGRVAVMYAGRIVETGPSGAVFAQPSHPYTIGLQSAFPELGGDEQELISIPGSLPHGPQHSGGCLFADRCPFARPLCRRQAPALAEIGPGHFAACHFQSEMAAFRTLGSQAATWEPARAMA